ncbi:MAG: cysteine synthase [Oscillospiraceae bacterium]|nr:cysteine synthase [Oscillospiraceae bacterium]
MGKIYGSVLDVVGHTPLVELQRLGEKHGGSARILAKLEFFNPAGSVKDRIAKEIIEAAEREGTLAPGGTIVEGTSGNTGIGLAAIAAVKGYRSVIVMPDNMSQERISILKGYGAKVVLTPAEQNIAGAGAKAAELAASIPGAFIPAQGANPANPAAHYQTTGPEIWEDTDGEVDIFIATAGTGGTITGAGTYLREKKPEIEIILVEPAGCPVFSGGEPGPHKIQGIGGGLIPPVASRDIYNEVITVTDEDAYRIARELAREEGISAGISAGAAVWAALEVAARPGNAGKRIVVIIPDSGERYLSSDLYDEELEAESTEGAVRPRPMETQNEIDETGAFIRQKNHFTTPFGDGEGQLKAEAGRYRLFWAKGCHWSNRASIVRELLGLEDSVGINLVGHEGGEGAQYGWAFVHDEGHRDPVLGVRYLSELYYNADPAYTGRCTVPALVDVTTKQVVNNDYHRLTNYLETAFRPFHKKGAPDLYPEPLRQQIDALNDWLFPHVNNATYRMMFAQSIGAYEEAFEDFYQSLDVLEARLQDSRFLFGDYVTDSDIRLFVTLARFDTHYYRNLGPIKKRIADYQNLWGYARDLYEIPAFRHNTYLRDIAAGGTRDQSVLFEDFNTRFADQIDYDALWSTHQNRWKLSKTPDQKFKLV